MPRQAMMELDQHRAFEFTTLGIDYVAYHHHANAMFVGKTRIYDLDMSDETPILELSGIFDRPGCEAAVMGYKVGIKAGEAAGAATVKRALRQMLDLPSLADVEALDGRMDRLAQGAAR